MKKITFYSFLVFLFLFTNVFSAYRTFIPTNLKQPDNTSINIYASGDEYYNWLHDADGYTIMQNQQTGYYVFAIKIDDKLIPSDYIVNRADPKSLGIDKWLKIAPEEIMKRRNFFKAPEKPITKNKNNQTLVTNYGTIQNVVIFIHFSDQAEFTDQLSTFDGQYNAASGSSLFAYYKEVTYNQLEIKTSFSPTQTGTTVISYRDANPRGYYSPKTVTNTIGYANDNELTDREHKLLKRAVDYCSTMIPASLNIDNDNDGYVDNISFVVNGTNDAWATLLWPHMWALYTQDAYINSKRVWNYNLLLQSWTYSSRAVSVLCHEMFHTLGSPDLYHYTGNGIQPADGWDIMENDANPPQHMGAFMKYKYGGWISTLPEITKSGTYTLNPVTKPTNNIFKIKSPKTNNQYFVVEYRKQEGFDVSLPGTGLLVYRINPLAGDGNAGGPPDEVYIYRPDGTTSANGNPGKANFSLETGRVRMNDTTNPKAFLPDGSIGSLNIFNIGSAGNTISFYVSFAPPIPTLISPTDNFRPVALSPKFTWNASPGATSYGIQISDKPDFSTNVYTELGITATSRTLPISLNNFTKYYWRVNSANSVESSLWSDAWSFTTKMGNPVLVYPANLDVRIPITPKFTWNILPGANSYNLEISTTADFSNIVFSQKGITGNSFTIPTELKYYTNYYWHLQGVSTFETSDWSSGNLFTTSSAAPQIVYASKSQEACLNANINFEVVAQSVNVNYQWQKDGEDIPGATNTLYYLPNVNFENSAQYRCKINNWPSGSDTVYTNDMLLYVAGRSEFTRQPQAWSTFIDGWVKFDFDAHIVGLPLEFQPKIQWYKGNTALVDNDRIAGSMSSVLMIKKMQDTDFGNDYHVRLIGKCGDTIYSENVEVKKLDKKGFVGGSDGPICKGKSTFIYNNDPPLVPPDGHTFIYKWFDKTNGKEIISDDTFEITREGLLIKKIEKGYSILLKIYILPENLEYASFDVGLNMIDIPVITQQPLKLLTAETSKDFTLEVQIEPTRNEQYQWFKDNVLITGATSATFTKTGVTTADQGKYYCRVSNLCGTVYSDTAEVTVTFMNISDVKENEKPSIYSTSIPNPFSESTKISLMLNEPSQVKLSIVDVLGRQIVVLTDNSFKVGSYVFEFNAVDYNLSSGIYYYIIATNDMIITRPLILIK